MTHEPQPIIDFSAPGYLRGTADRYDEHGATTRRLLEADWSGAPSGVSYEPRVSGGGGGSPVERHVVAGDSARYREAENAAKAARDGVRHLPGKHPAVLLDRWDHACWRIAGDTDDVAVWLRWLADKWPDIGANSRPQITDAARELNDIMNLCRPLPAEIVAKLTNLEVARSYCQACRSVSSKLVGGLCRDPGSNCYDLLKRREQRGQFTTLTEFIADVQAGIARGEINRPSSPYWRTAVPTIHEGDPAA